MPMQIRYHLISLWLLSVLVQAAGPVPDIATPFTQRWEGKTVKHSWNAVPQYWESLGHPTTNSTIDLYFALKPKHENALSDTFHEVSNPRHAKYGAYLSKEQVAELVAPHPDTLSLISSWLVDHGIPPSSISMTLGGNWLMAIGVPVPQANDILSASYQRYQNVETKDTVLRTISYSLPDALHEHIQTVVPTTYFGSTLMKWEEPHILSRGVAVEREKGGSNELATVLEGRDLFTTPGFVRTLYNTIEYEPTAGGRNKLATVGLLNQYPNPGDLRAFMQDFRADGLTATCTIVLINGGIYTQSNPGITANHNLQYASAMTFPTPNLFYSVGGKLGSTTDPYVNWFASMQAQETLPQTIIITYASNEKDVPPDYAAYVCNEFMKLGSRGVSVIVSSGNWGVGRDIYCLVVDRLGNVRIQFLPQFPASCPWVTTVGGTAGRNPEVAAGLSGGGFSNHFLRPAYQQNVIPPFLDNIRDLHRGSYNSIGRGIPDLAAQSLNCVFVQNGKHDVLSGTGCSTVIVAGIISLLNDYRISHGEPALGFLNNWLYGHALDGYNDIESGRNPGCATNGFPAIKGWDPVTGLGTPDFKKLLELLITRPPVTGPVPTAPVARKP